MNRQLTILVTVLVAISLGTTVGAAQQPTNSEIADDGEILSCTTITQPGEYYLGGDLEGNADEACISIEHTDSTVTIDGNGHTLQGPNTDGTIGVNIASDSYSGGVEIHDITISGWDDGIKQSSGHFSFHDATVIDNQQGYSGTQMSIDFENVQFTNNENIGITTSMTLPMTLTNVQVNNNGGGMGMIDGGRLTVTDSEFNNNENNGLSIGHSMNGSFTNVEVSGNGGAGIDITGTAMGTKTAFEDSTITNNGQDGIVVRVGPDNDQIDLTNVHIDGNEHRAITAYNAEGDRALARVNATDVTLGGGLTVNFEQEAPLLETTATDWSATDTINVSGEPALSMETTFDVDGENGQLWKETAGEWSKKGEYSTSDGRFTETLSSGHWAGDTSAQVTPTPTPTPMPSPSPTPEPTPMETKTPTATPTETDSGTQPAAGTDIPTVTPTPTDSSPGSGNGNGADGSDSPANTPTETESDGSTTTPVPGKSPSSTDTGETTGTENEQATSSPTGSQATAENQTNTGDDEDGSSSADAPGFTAILALFGLVGTTLLLCRR